MLVPLRIKSSFACVSAVALARSIHTDLGKWIGQSCQTNQVWMLSKITYYLGNVLKENYHFCNIYNYLNTYWISLS